METNGIVTYVPLSGGFWGILAENGRKLRPVAPIPDEFLEEGLPVFVVVEPVETFSIYMWGTDVEVLRIEKLTDLESKRS